MTAHARPSKISRFPQMVKLNKPINLTTRHLFTIMLIIVVLTLQSLKVYGLIQTSLFNTPVRLTAGQAPIYVVTGDFNRDGNLDIATSNSQGNSVSVFLGDGVGGFAAPKEFPTGIRPLELVKGDFNGDGIIDLAVTNTGENSISILLGDGTGTFSPIQKIPVAGAPATIRAADFDGDGRLDLATGNIQGQTISILRGAGDGSFIETERIAIGNQVFSIDVGDLNGDGKLDLVVDTGVDIFLLFGNGSGSFNLSGSFSLPNLGGQVVAADINGDGKLDLVFHGYSGADQPSDYIFVGDGTGTFIHLTDLSLAKINGWVTVADVNGDGKLDLAVVSNGELTVTLGNGDGSFGSTKTFAAGGGPASAAVGNFNKDGKLDIVIAEGYGSAPPGYPNVAVLLGDGSGSFNAARDYDIGTHFAKSMTAGDFNGDGKMDVATANYEDNNVSILLGDGAGAFAPPMFIPVGSGPLAIASADLNRDGKLDLIVANSQSDDVSILLGDGSGSFVLASSLSAQPYPTAVIAGDFNNDGKPDLSLTTGVNGDVLTFLGDGAGGFSAPFDTPAALDPVAISSGDFNRDGKADLAVVDEQNGVWILTGNGDGTFNRVMDTALTTGQLPSAIAVGDFNGDGNPDLAVTNAVDNTVSVLFGDGAGEFAPAINYSSGAAPFAITAADINADGHLDLVVVNEQSYDVSVLLGDGAGSFSSAGNFAVGSGPTFLVAGEFNNDGRTDLAVVNEFSVSVLLGNAVGTFTPAGSNVFVSPVDSSSGTKPVTLTFSTVLQSGTTALTTSASGPQPPAGFQVGSPVTYYELSTTALVSGPIEVCINYAGVSFPDPGAVQLFHFKGGVWQNVTSSVDTTNQIVCGTSTSLSPFAVFEDEIQALTNRVNRLSLNSGEKNSLITKLTNIRASLTKDKQAARGQLSAFVNEVTALKRSGRLSPSTADALIAQAQMVVR